MQLRTQEQTLVVSASASVAMPTVPSACDEMQALRLCFKDVYFMRGLGLKGGDLMVGAGAEGMDFSENTCTVEGRARQHDPIIMQ